MTIIRHSQAKWTGDVLSGTGHIDFGSTAFSGPYSFKDRIESSSAATNPEELIAAAHAGCFSMAFSAALGKEGATDIKIETVAKVHLIKEEGGFSISQINLETTASANNISDLKLREIAHLAKKNCPISKALNAVPVINLTLNGQ